MKFDLERDEHGRPYHVHTDDGFVMCRRPFDPDSDGWMEDQLDPNEFLSVRAGREAAWLVAEVNSLRRENFTLRKDLEMWKGAAGFGVKK